MKIATTTLRSLSPYSQSRPIASPREPKETAEDHEKRTWRERMHVSDDGHVFIPPMAFKNCIAEAAKFLSKQIPGKGKATYTKHFEAGILVTDAPVLPLLGKDVAGEWLFLNADGVRGSGKRVWKQYPVIPEWRCDVTWYVLDDTITEEVFEETLREAGSFIGVGRFRPRNGGYYGRFTVEAVQWRTEADAQPQAAE